MRESKAIQIDRQREKDRGRQTDRQAEKEGGKGRHTKRQTVSVKGVGG